MRPSVWRCKRWVGPAGCSCFVAVLQFHVVVQSDEKAFQRIGAVLFIRSVLKLLRLSDFVLFPRLRLVTLFPFSTQRESEEKNAGQSE